MLDNKFFIFKVKIDKVWTFPTKRRPPDRVKAG
nr:MAG TPA: hypothetical protein [Caudoviricetes sp.]